MSIEVGQELIVHSGYGYSKDMSVTTVERVLKQYFECTNGKKYNLDMRQRAYSGRTWSTTPSVKVSNEESLAEYSKFKRGKVKSRLIQAVKDGVFDELSMDCDESLIEIRDLIHSYNDEWFKDDEMEFKTLNTEVVK